jgi:hypothetical protein
MRSYAFSKLKKIASSSYMSARENRSSLHEVELIPEGGTVQKLKIPDQPVASGQPLAFLIPRNHL